VPHAAGLAWGKKLKGERALALTFFGDGATSEGAFHEGANFAAVMQAPLILFCNNNQCAISTPITAQTRAEALVDKAVGYGMPGIRVDGGDVLAVFEATREAVERARSGGGPTFIEALSYRAAPHATADDPRLYVDLERVEQEKQNECLGRYERYLRRQGVLGDDLDAAIKSEAADVMRAGIAEAEAEPDADVSLLFENVYANPPASLQHDLAELRRILVVAGRRAEHDHAAIHLHLGVIDTTVVARHADILFEAECVHEELESGIRVLVEQIRHHARVPLGRVLRHGVAPFRLAPSKN
jgi:pyruvate dehydrogenase E1 component alpha subunit